jgi:hypothetical protein
MKQESYEKLQEIKAAGAPDTMFDRVHKLWAEHEALLDLAGDAEVLLSEIVSRHMGDLLPRENFWRECGAVAEKIRAALDERSILSTHS